MLFAHTPIRIPIYIFYHVLKSATLPFEMWAKLECVSNCDFVVVPFGNSDIIVRVISLCGISRGE